MAVDIDTTAIDSILSESLAGDAVDSVAPWLNSEFLESHLQSYFRDKQIKIASYEVKPATAKGENYASYLYRVKVKYTDDLQRCAEASNLDTKQSTLNIIVKTAVSGEFAYEALAANNIYNKEIEFYSKIAPKINLALDKLNEPNQLIAKPYGVCNANNAILFEDLTTHGYRIASVYRGFNFEEAQIVLKKAATLHAIHAVLQQEEPNIFDNFRYGLMSRHTDVLDTFYITQLDVLMEVVETWPDGDYFMEKLHRLRGTMMEKGANAFGADPDHFNTMIHGDMWVNNLMLKYTKAPDCDEETIENVIFIDFQYSCWTSPSIDLHYFFNNSLEESLRPNRFDELFAFYHGHLSDFLTRLDYQKPIPSLEQFKRHYLDKSFYGFIASCIIQPLMINEENEDADVEALIVGDERSMKYKRIIYSSPKVRANLRKLIPIYDKMGIFD